MLGAFVSSASGFTDRLTQFAAVCGARSLVLKVFSRQSGGPAFEAGGVITANAGAQSGYMWRGSSKALCLQVAGQGTWEQLVKVVACPAQGFRHEPWAAGSLWGLYSSPSRESLKGHSGCLLDGCLTCFRHCPPRRGHSADKGQNCPWALQPSGGAGR